LFGADLRGEFALEFLHPGARDLKGGEPAGGVAHGYPATVAGVWLAVDEAEPLEVVEGLRNGLPGHLGLGRHLAGTRAVLAQVTQHDRVTGLDRKTRLRRGREDLGVNGAVRVS